MTDAIWARFHPDRRKAVALDVREFVAGHWRLEIARHDGITNIDLWNHSAALAVPLRALVLEAPKWVVVNARAPMHLILDEALAAAGIASPFRVVMPADARAAELLDMFTIMRLKSQTIDGAVASASVRAARPPAAARRFA